jgi:hypothetical protein
MTWADTEPLAGHWPTVSAVPVCTAQCHCAFIFRSTDFSVGTDRLPFTNLIVNMCFPGRT